MNIAEQAFSKLYPEEDNKAGSYSFSVKYSGKFNPYNANVRKYGGSIVFNLSREWKKIGRDIRMGLMQELLAKLFRKNKENKKTTEMELYNIFIKNVHMAVPKTKTEPVLQDSFRKLNDAHFFGMIEQPNLVWGSHSVRKLGSYEYGSDTITISSILRGEDRNLLDYVMYHEMLHKKLKFDCRNGRSRSHTPEFKSMEANFPDSEIMERKLRNLAVRKSGFKSFIYTKKFSLENFFVNKK